MTELAQLLQVLSGDHGRLTAALLVNARQVGERSPAVLLELQADLVGLRLPA